MTGKTKSVITALLLLATANASAGAFDNLSIDSVTFSYGRGQGDADIYRISAQSRWNKSWLNEGNWHVTGYWNATAGHWHSDKAGGHEDNAFELALTPVFRLEQKNSRDGHLSPYVEAGVGVHLIGPTSIGDRSLSNVVQFGSRVGIGLRFGENGKYDLGYRFQHLSNAALDDPNDGFDLHTINLGIRY
ncbi:MAG: acyloxyacyl hydrolase [Gammaproteobacteria bacterium]